MQMEEFYAKAKDADYIICSKDCMNIFDHGSKFGGFLEKIFTRTPHISILHCLKICQKITFCHWINYDPSNPEVEEKLEQFGIPEW